MSLLHFLWSVYVDDNKQVGYIKKGTAKHISKRMDNGENIEAEISKVYISGSFVELGLVLSV